MKKSIVYLTIGILNLGLMFGQSASISPSRFYYKQMPGESGTQTLRVTNNGTKTESFQVTFSNFVSEGNQGKTVLVDDSYEQGCAGWLSASPAFFTVEPGETKNIDIHIQVPSTPDAMSVRWAVGQMRLASERTAIEERGANVTGIQILQTFQFLFHVFQTPPSMQNLKEATLLSFTDVTKSNDSNKELRMEVKNSGQAIIDCVPYIDILNTASGETKRVMNKPFSVLPGGVREVFFNLTDELAKGKYSIIGIVDYGSKTDLAGAEIELTVQ
jgi:hypothetical protein